MRSNLARWCVTLSSCLIASAVCAQTPVSSSAGIAGSSTPGLKLIPVPRQLRAGDVQSLSAGVQVNCLATCSAEDQTAIEDFKTTLADRGIVVNTSAPVTVLVTRYGSALANSIYSDAARTVTANAASEMPAEMRPE